MAGAESLVYLDALAYDPAYYRGVGHALKQHLDRAEVGVLGSGEEELVFAAGFEPARLNVGDYSALKNVGGQFPIGEVFTESRDLTAVSGRVRIALFGDLAFTVNRPSRPITLIVEAGRVTGSLDSTPEFERVLESIRADEGEVWLRELGLGMNRAFSLERTVSDVGAFERMCGVHLSLGSKHAVYSKPNIRKKTARQHVDVFVATSSLRLDGQELFAGGAWLPS
jgi:leucyl aminopeptidase (aminopeptidase T)